MPKKPFPVPTPPECRETLGLAPAILANRDFTKVDKTNLWCASSNLADTDRYSDPLHPKTITYAHVLRADEMIKEFKVFTATPLLKSRFCKEFGVELYYKLETVHKPGSFHERSAFYSLQMLSDDQRDAGVFTASVGNWAMALSYQGQKLKIKVSVVVPFSTHVDVVAFCKSFGATVYIYGDTIIESKRRAFQILRDQGGDATYINGYDHPHVIAGAGTIGLEILDQLPDVHTIIIPIGGGGLIAGISAATKYLKPEVNIYGVEPNQSCSFFKAMDNERPYAIEAVKGVAASLTVPVAGENAFHTAQSLIDKMVLVDDDWICRAVLHLTEEEKLIAEGAGAISLGALLSIPNILPELQGKKVVCIISGANINALQLNQVISRGKSVDGRIITFTVRLDPDIHLDHLKVFKVIGSIGANIVRYQAEKEWLTEGKLLPTFLTIQCETRDLKHACTLKRVMEKLFPDKTDFPDDVFKPIKSCVCFPKKKYT